MTVDLLLPCIRFTAVIYPGDPRWPTDLEYAMLYYVRHYDDAGGADTDDLQRFLGLDAAVFEDMLIRMVNRGWIEMNQDESRHLFLSRQAERVLDNGPDSIAASTLSTTEEGKRFWVCYDLIGGRFAVVPNRLLSKGMDDARAVPRGPSFKDTPNIPYGKKLDGYMSEDPSFAEPKNTRILQALISDREASKYLRGIRGRLEPKVHVLPPSRALTLSDVHFYRCRFEVRRPAEGVFPDEEGYADGAFLPELECVEQRNRSIRRLGAANAEKVLDNAVHARNVEGESRFFRILTQAAETEQRKRQAVPDPIEALNAAVGTFGEDSDHEDLLELLSAVIDRIEMLNAGRLDFLGCRLCAPNEVRETVAELVKAARETIVISSPEVRMRSPALDTDPASVLSMLAIAETGSGPARVQVHGVKGATYSGVPVSDDAAISRIATALGTEQVHVVDRSLNHLRNSFVLVDSQRLLWLNGSLLGNRVPRGLVLTLKEPEAGSFRQILHLLPGGGRGSGGEGSVRETPQSPGNVLASLNDVTELVGKMGAWSTLSPVRQRELVEDLHLQLDALSEWHEVNADAVEVLAGSALRDRAMRLIGENFDGVSLVVGLSGNSDARLAGELLEDIALRLSRQHLSGNTDVRTLLLLPAEEEFSSAAVQFTNLTGMSSKKLTMLRPKPRDDRTRPISFILTPNVALIASDGLARYVPTVGRRMKGTNLGLQFLGVAARNLAAQFLAREWPDVATELHADSASTSSLFEGELPISRLRLEEVKQRAASDEWLTDGNMGANRAGNWIRSSIEEGGATARSALDIARSLLAAEASDDRSVGRALLKALASAEDTREIECVGGLRTLAQAAVEANDMLIAALLADDLPADSVYRRPLVRRLAFHLARGSEVSLNADDQAHLEVPSGTLQSLACLMMMDGLGDSLSHWLAHIDPERTGGQTAAFTRVLANYVRHTHAHRIDLGHIAEEDGVARLETAIERIRVKARSDRMRRTGGLHPSVVEIKKLIFYDKASYTAKLYDFVLTTWDQLAEHQRPGALIALLRSFKGDIGIDLVAAASVHGQSIDSDKLVLEYFARKNEEMQRITGHEGVIIERAGRDMITSLRSTLRLILTDIVPALLGQFSPEDRALSEEARRLLDAPVPENEGTEAFLARLLRKRILSTYATDAVRVPRWIYPHLAGLDLSNWPRLRHAFLMSEFPRDSKLHQVVQWLVDEDRVAGSRDPGNAKESSETLTLLHDLLESIPTEALAESRGQAGSLTTRLNEIVANTERDIDDATAFMTRALPREANLGSAIIAAIDQLGLLRESIAERDLIGAIITANDLRAGTHRNLLDVWGATSRSVVAEIKKNVPGRMAPQLDRIFQRRVQVAHITEARHYVELAPALEVAIDLNSDLLLNLREDGDVNTGVVRNRLTELVIRARTGRLKDGEIEGLLPLVVARTVMGALSELDEFELRPVARKDGRVWRVSCRHPSIAGLGFLGSNEVEFILPFDREEEIALRRRLRATLTSTVGRARTEPSKSWHVPRSRDTPVEILISLHSSEHLSGMPTILGRYLLRCSDLSSRARHVAILADLARQRFADPADVAHWWPKDASSQESLLTALLDPFVLDEENTITRDDVVGSVRDLCLALGLYTFRDNARLALTPRGVAEVARRLGPMLNFLPENRLGRIRAIGRTLEAVLDVLKDGRVLAEPLPKSNIRSRLVALKRTFRA